MGIDIKKYHPFVVFLFIILGIYLLYLLLVWLGKVFVYLGYNSFFFLDNLLFVPSFNPVVMWTILGSFIGALVGTAIAIIRYRLNLILILFPSALLVLFAALMAFVNQPANYNGSYVWLANNESTDTTPQAPKRDFYILNTTINVRSGPSVNYPKVLVLTKGIEVEVLQRGYFTSQNMEWFRIKYLDQEGYVNSTYLEYSRSEN